jgi:hypothetical protein
MKKIVLPALLCAAYSTMLTCYFSTDFSKQNSFLLPEIQPRVMMQLEPAAPMIKYFPRDRATIVPRMQTLNLNNNIGPASPESAAK